MTSSAYDIYMSQLNSSKDNYNGLVISDQGVDGLMGYSQSSKLPSWWKLGTGLSFNTITKELNVSFPTIPTVQAIRAQTNTSGLYTWTFSPAFPVGVIPIISLSVEDNSAAFWNHQIIARSNTSVTVQLQKTIAVTLLGISVLGVATTSQAYVQLIATPSS